jgi:diguanylate cyclase (GGDEF)-like protein
MVHNGVTAASTHRRLLVLTAIGLFAAVFVSFLAFENPGLGIGHFYYLPVALIALCTGPRIGALAGCAATALYAFGVLLNPDIPSAELLTVSAGIRLIIFAGSGAILGWFAASNQTLVEKLQILAERDHLTGLPNTRAFETAIARRFDSGRPFALLLGDMDGLKDMNDRQGEVEGDDALRRLGGMLTNALDPADELARVGGDEFAVLAALGSTQEAARLATRLESVLAGTGLGITFGWAVHPQDGLNALSLYRAADERLYARKYIRSPRRRQTPALPANGEATRSLHVAG